MVMVYEGRCRTLHDMLHLTVTGGGPDPARHSSLQDQTKHSYPARPAPISPGSSYLLIYYCYDLSSLSSRETR